MLFGCQCSDVGVMQIKKKVCIIVPNHISARIGGAQYQADFLTRALVETGEYDVYFLSKWTGKGFDPDGYTLINITPRSLIKRGIFLLSIPKLYKTLKKIKPDYIYQRVGCTYTGVAAFYCKNHGAKMIWHIAHDCDVDKNINIHKQRLIQRIEQKIFEYGIKNTDMIVAQTNYQSDRLYESYNRHATLVVSNFHPVPEITHDKNKVITILWIGNLKTVKRPEVFIGLAEKLGDLSNVKFIMVGEEANDAAWHQSLMEHINDINNLEYIGRQDHDAVHDLLSRSHIFVNTSKWEGFSNTFIEAWMREVPVITLGINPDNVLTRNKIGFCAKDFDELVVKVRNLIVDQELRCEYAKNARLYSQKHHSITNVTQLLNLLD